MVTAIPICHLQGGLHPGVAKGNGCPKWGPEAAWPVLPIPPALSWQHPIPIIITLEAALHPH